MYTHVLYMAVCDCTWVYVCVWLYILYVAVYAIPHTDIYSICLTWLYMSLYAVYVCMWLYMHVIWSVCVNMAHVCNG